MTDFDSVHFESLANLLSEPTLLLHVDGTMIAANQAAAEWCGQPHTALAGAALGQWLADPPEKLADYLRTCARSRQGVPGSLQWRDGQGGSVTCPCVGVAAHPDSEGAGSVLLRCQPRRHALHARPPTSASPTSSRRHEELLAQREWLGAVLMSIGDAVIATDLAGDILLMNHTAEELTGWPLHEARGNSITEVFHIINGNTRQLVPNPLDRVLSEGVVVGLANHTVLIARDGTEYPIDDSGAPIRDRQGNLIGAVLVFRDITEQKQAQKVQARLAAIVESSDDAIIGKNLDGTIVSWNEGASRIFGYTREEVLGQKISLLIPPDHAGEMERLLNSIRHGQRVERLETDRICKDGRRIHVSLTVSPIKDASGRIIGASKIARDITNRKHAEAQLQALNETLEERVAERTAVAEQRAAQLRALAAELTQAEHRERRRLAQVLHDHLQQLLVAAKMRIGALRDGNGGVEAADTARQIEELLAQSIDASRSLTVELSPPILYDGGLPVALEWLARRMEEGHGLKTELIVDPDTAEIGEALAVFLFQAVRELLFNVVKHAGVVAARVTVSNCDENRLQIVVADEGRGITPDRLEYGAEGAGFGLFSIRERIELLGGRMEIDSLTPQGTCITMTVPLPSTALATVHAEPPADVRPEDRPDPAAQPDDPPLAHSYAGPRLTSHALDRRVGSEDKIRVLLADDHKIFREGLIGLLRLQPDLEVIGEASDGEEALRLARQTRPDVVVMDVTMPRLNGIEATRRVTAELPGIRVIGLSMHEEQDMAAAMRNAGAAAYLTKDGPAHALIAAIRDTAP